MRKKVAGWYIPGYQHPYLLAIRCNVVGPMNWGRDPMPGDEPFVDVDEPVGHSLNLNGDFIRTRVYAEKYLRENMENSRLGKKRSTLEGWRRAQARFILKTHGKSGKKEMDLFLSEYRDKKEGVDWFTIE